MQTYFFDFFNGKRWFKDDIGQEIAEMSDISQEAKIALMEVAREHIVNNNSDNLKFDVKDKTGKSVYRLTLILKEENPEFTDLPIHVNVEPA